MKQIEYINAFNAGRNAACAKMNLNDNPYLTKTKNSLNKKLSLAWERGFKS